MHLDQFRMDKQSCPPTLPHSHLNFQPLIIFSRALSVNFYLLVLMKAIIFEKYGSAEVVKLKEVAKPDPKPKEVLIKVHSTAVNDYDWSIMRGKPYAYRLFFGLFSPKNTIPGMEVAGVVESVGEQVTHLKGGDRVFGDTSDFGFGTFAEYVCIDARAFTHIPEGMSFDEATTLPHAGLLAKQGLIDLGGLKEKQDILINGGGGGVGTIGLQIAKEYQATVAGVDTGEKLQTMRDLGFDEVIDYKQTDFTRTGKKYDLILDAKTSKSPFAYLRALKPGGTYVTVGGKVSKFVQVLIFKGLISLLYKKRVCLLGLNANKGLDYIIDLYNQGKIKPLIDGPYPLSQTAEAIQRFGEGKHHGKVVVNP